MGTRLSASLLLLASALHSQEFRGTILGRITDPTGAVVVGAAVRVRNVDTNLALDTRSNEQGNYQLPFLPPGNYAVTVEHPGFRNIERPS
ncbi:MAG: carboxypeptidase regulatory-like domain-containing protein, partial [Acidobacteria bacterium]|nr:carboxypeptidase regulatory-like domain-containing protein [Acidobacteriota bacterium]